MLHALTRAVPDSFAQCELTCLERVPIDVDRARRQHADYCELLAELGCEVVHLVPEPELPDSVFVEDAAIVTDEVAVLLRPGAVSRRGEVDSVGDVLAQYREVARVEAPAVVDGGDVLVVGRNVFVGRSSRTDDAGVSALAGILEPHGYSVTPVDVDGCLHLKSAVTAVADDTVLVQPGWVDVAAFAAFDAVSVDPAEPHGANVLRVGDVLVVQPAFPRTRERLEARGHDCRSVDASELAKAEGALTCCSILVAG